MISREELSSAVRVMRLKAIGEVCGYAAFNCPDVSVDEVLALLPSLGEVSVLEFVTTLDRLQLQKQTK